MPCWARRGQLSNPDKLDDNGFPGACAGGRWERPAVTSRSSRRLPSRPTGPSSPLSIRGTRPDPGLLNSYGRVTAALRRAVEVQPAVEDRSFQVVIDGERTGQTQRPTEARFGGASKGSRGRSGSVNGTRRVDSQKAVPVIHKDAFPDLPFLLVVTTRSPNAGARDGTRHHPHIVATGALDDRGMLRFLSAL